MNCPIEQDLYRHLDQIDADNRAFEQAAELANDPAFIVRVVRDLGIYDAISGTGKEVAGLSSADQIALADDARDILILFMAGKQSQAQLIAALEKCRPAFDEVIFNAAQDELAA